MKTLIGVRNPQNNHKTNKKEICKYLTNVSLQILPDAAGDQGILDLPFKGITSHCYRFIDYGRTGCGVALVKKVILATSPTVKNPDQRSGLLLMLRPILVLRHVNPLLKMPFPLLCRKLY